MKKKKVPSEPAQLFRNVLLPVDLTDRHMAAINIVAKLLHPEGQATFLHVVETIAGLPDQEEDNFYARLEEASRKNLARLVQAMKHLEMSCSAAVVRGHRVAEVVRFAKDAKIDLIVVTTPPVDPLKPTSGWGSLGYKIALAAPCPVLLAK